MEKEALKEVANKAVVESYLRSFEEQNLEACMALFSEDAVLQFGPATLGLGQFRGREGIEKWHRERFDRGARISKIENIKVKGDEVRVHGVFTSPRLKAVRIADLRGQGTFLFDGDKVKELKLGLRRGYRFHI